jgi:hypothetical protein
MQVHLAHLECKVVSEYEEEMSAAVLDLPPMNNEGSFLVKTDIVTPQHASPQTRWSAGEMIESKPKQGKGASLLQRWYALTAIPEAPAHAEFAQREAARKSRLTSSVLFFFTIMVVVLLPACFLAPYPSYFWLDLGLVCSCIVALALNRQGYTIAAGVLVNVTGFLALTIALFSTIPFDETTLQGYDMYVIVELLSVSLLPTRSIFFAAILSMGSVIVTLFTMKHTVTLDADLHNRLLIIVARPIGTLFLVAGVAYILAATMEAAIERAGRAELVARLQHEIAEREHALAEQKRELDIGIQQILSTHVAVANGDWNARAPLTQDNVLWQIARALNTLLVRFQRAAQAERDLHRVEQVVAYYVENLQQAEQEQRTLVLPLAHTPLDPLVVALQGKTIGQARPLYHSSSAQFPASAQSPRFTPRR